MMKISRPNEESLFLYDKVYENVNNCLKIAVDENQVNLLLQLADCLQPPYYILYVLTVSRLGNELGRYQSPLFESKEQLSDFLNEFKLYIETDARHHLWIGTVDNSGLLVYDQHNVIYAYGNIEEYQEILDRNDYRMQSFSFPVPHTHHYHLQNDTYEEKILNYFDWSLFPLEDGDDY